MWLLLLLITVPLVKADDECPAERDIYPCYCSNDYYLTTIDCEHIRGLHKISNVLNNTMGMNVSYSFWNSDLGDIPSDIFQGQQCRNLNFEDCNINSFGDRPFSGLEDTLTSINIRAANIKKRGKDLTFRLGHLKKLETLVFTYTDIKTLGNDWFEDGPASLTEIDLEANDIKNLGDEAFAKLVNLKQLWLGNNYLKNMNRSMLPQPANELQLLEISYNDIKSLPEDFFEEMPALHLVNLSGNRLQTIPEDVWGKVWNQLEEVYMDNNYGFICDNNLKWIYQRAKLPRIFTGYCAGGNITSKYLDDLTIEDFE